MYPKNATRPALFALGFLSIGTQIYLLREFMIVFNDNELIIGLVLATWMLITGIGSFSLRLNSMLKWKTGMIISFMVVAGFLPSLMIASLGFLKAVMVPDGSMADLWQVCVACLLVQLPFCFLNGFLFSVLSISSPGIPPGGSYSWESIGSMASGALVNFLFLWFLEPFQGLLILTGVYLMLVCVFTLRVATKKQFYVVVSLSLAFIILPGGSDFRALTERMLYPSQHVISGTETPYGQVVITKNEHQLNFFENGMLLFSSGNEISNEENVHYAMVQHPHPSNILLISGGFSGTLSEILKYRPDHIDYVELNPALIGIGSRYTNQLGHPSISVHETDARRFLRRTSYSYDIVLVNLPSPSTLQLNRYYTVEFLKEVREKLRPGAIVAYSLPTGGDYVSERAGKINSVIWNTMKQCFAQVLIVPAGRNYFLASDSALSLDIPGLVEARGIETVYVNKYYLDAFQLKERSAYVTGSITPSGSTTPSGWVNRDFTPVAVWYQVSWWLSHFNTTHAFILLVFIALLVILLRSLNPLSAGLFAGGFTLASIEIILIFSLQVLCGYLFQAIGAIIMVFMLGLAAGSGWRIRSDQMKTLGFYGFLQVLLAVTACTVPFIIQWLGRTVARDWLVNMVFALLAFFAAFIVGMEYRLAASLSKNTLQHTVAGNYAAELFGSAAGAFAVTLFLIPAIGLVNTGIILAVVNLTSAGSLFFLNHNWHNRSHRISQ
jgi:spermidine synthase